MSLDLDFVRSQFPALAERLGLLRQCRRLAGPAATVAERVADYLLTTSVQTGASYDRHSRRAPGSPRPAPRMATAVHRRTPRRNRVRTFDHSPAALPGDRDGQPAERPATRSSSPTSTMNRISARGSVLEDAASSSRSWNIDPDDVEPELEDLDKLMTAADPTGLRHARVEHSRHHQPDPRDRRLRA